MADSKPDFNHRHPDYLRMVNRWRMAWDFWRGGIQVLEPDHEVGVVRWASDLSSDDDGSLESDLGRKLTNFEWHTAAVNSYLWKHETESPGDYSERQSRQIHLPVFQMVVNILTAGVLRIPPKRENPIEPFWGEYWNDADRAGTNHDAQMRQALALALDFGRVHAITDRPAFSDDATSVAEQIARGDRAYTYLITPLDLVDWTCDDSGNFIWAVVREPYPDVREPGEEHGGEACQYRVWYPNQWELWLEGEDGFEIIASQEHGAGRVPISTLWASRDARQTQMCCESPLADVLDVDRDVLNKLSELDELERRQCFSILWLPEIEGMPGGAIDIGPASAITGNAEAGAPQYVSPDPKHADGKWQRIQEKLWAVRQMAGVGRGKAEYSKEERSADSIALESEDKKNQLAWLAAAVEEFDRQIHGVVAAWHGADEFPQPSYTKDFDMKGIAAAINEITSLKATNIIPRETVAAMAKPVVAKIMRQQGATRDEIDEAVDAVDAEAAKEPEVLIPQINPEKPDNAD